MSRRRLQFRLRSLLLITVAVGVVCGVLGPQFAGRIQTRSDPGFVTDFRWSRVDFSGSSATLACVCATEDDARNLAARFDWKRFCSRLDAGVGRNDTASERVLRDFSVNSGQSANIFFIKYDFSQWGRYRLDARHMAYVFDSNYPAAESRNAAVHRAFQQAGEAFVQGNPEIQTWTHIP